MKPCILSSLFTFFATVVGSCAVDTPILTVCDLLDRASELGGRDVVLVGEYSATTEGAWLQQACQKHIETAGFVWRDIVSININGNEALSPSRLAALQSEPELEHSIRAVEASLLGSGITYAVYGRIKTKRLRVVRCGTRLCGLGFGHMGWAPIEIECPAKFVVRRPGAI
jgi:hypothetical protein